MQPLLNKEIQEQIKTYLQAMKDEVTILLFTKDEPCETCSETTQLLQEVSNLSEKIHLVEKKMNHDKKEAETYHITLVPSFVMLDKNLQYHGVKFNGIPAGHEINSFLSAIIDMSGADFGITAAQQKRIQNIKKPVNIKVFVTLSCPHCPGAVQNAHRIAMTNNNIESEMIEAQTFYELSEKYQVSGVPKIVINEKIELLGNQPLEAYLNELEKL